MTAKACKLWLAGIHPRPPALVAATRDVDRGRTTPEACAQERARAARALAKAQEQAGFGFVSEGQYRWQDLARPFAESVHGMRAGALTRFFENNTFYRRPVVEDALEGRVPLERYLEKGVAKNGKIVFPAPYTLAFLCEDRFYGSQEALLEACTRLVADAARQAAGAGLAQVQFSDHALAYRAGRGQADREEVARAVEAVSEAARPARVHTVYHLPQGNAACLLPPVLEAGVDALGIDFTFTPMEELGAFSSWEKELAAGLVDAREALVEEPGALASALEEVARAAAPRGLALSPSCEMEYLPYAVAGKKMQAMTRAAALLEEGRA